MTTEQNIAIVAPAAFNSVVVSVFGLYLKSRFDAIDQRFDDMRDLWCAELRRVEEVIDARLKHLEER
jgi:hypothetical protein